jgi:pimeloyl-ACP methyl ester carboxylesterase
VACIVEPALDRWRAQGGPYTDARLVFVCHSMGGLVARWYIEHCGGAEVTRKLVTLGTPYRGAVKALEQLVNGVHKGIGPLAVDLTEFARSMPSMYQLLPEYAAIESGADLAKTTEIQVPELDAARIADGMRFHTQIADAEAGRPESLAMTHAILGINQPTATTARLAGTTVTLVDSYRSDELFGDSTVPIVAACRADVPMDSNTLRRVPDKHGNLPSNAAALDELEGILTAARIIVKAPDEVLLSVDAPELVQAGQTVEVQVTAADGGRHALKITVTDEAGRLVDSRQPKPTKGAKVTVFDELPPGAYSIDVAGVHSASPIAPVSCDVLVWG